MEHQVKVKKDLKNSDKNHVKILEDKLMKAEDDMFTHSEQFKIATDKLIIVLSTFKRIYGVHFRIQNLSMHFSHTQDSKG